MSVSTEDLVLWVDRMMKERNILIYKLDKCSGSTRGDGYLGEVNFIEVVVNSSDVGEEKVYNLVIKSANKSEIFRMKTPIQEAYYREMFMYTKVFPMLNEFQKEYALEDPFDQYAKCYSTCQDDKREALILKNLKSLGFEVHDRTIPQNLNHVLFVFKTYGKLHGTSLAMKTKKPALFKSMTKNMTDVLATFIIQADMIGNFVEEFKGAREILKKLGDSTLATKFEGFEDQIVEALTRMCFPDEPESVILHGDCWNNNMMFKYKDSNKTQPVSMCFIDFQLSKVASPILDLSYYLYTVADRSVLDNFDFLLQAYYRSLSDHLKHFGIIAEDIVTFDALKSQWKTYGKFGLAMAPFIIKIELCQSDEVVDFAESVEKGELKDALNIQIKNQDEFERRIKDVMEHFAEEFL
ncbi:unnamed protein product [Phaedon cochleariae]|uniref:CHK kinase-like domain-containing protein n=1 Tax=Phaedon cochleariae TaxID=80249 RepID=A0A9P0DQ52_PHACE|nr:unnamed protein product [Phaedon cochleariae]